MEVDVPEPPLPLPFVLDALEQAASIAQSPVAIASSRLLFIHRLVAQNSGHALVDGFLSAPSCPAGLGVGFSKPFQARHKSVAELLWIFT
jgi:hypothetical protein